MNEDMNVTVEDMQRAFGIEPEVDDTPADTPDTEEVTDTSNEQNEPTSEESGTEAETKTDTKEEPVKEQEKPPTQQPPTVDPNQQKTNQAFARMRVENAQMQKTMNLMAQVLGVNPNMPIDQLTAELQNRSMNAIAKANNMDPAILQRLDHLEAINAEYTKSQLEKTVMTAVDTIKTKYGATEQDLVAFINELSSEGYDISKPGSDLEQEFLRRNFSKILENKVNAAVAAEQERAAKGKGASKPDTKQGQNDNSDPSEIKTVDDLTQFLTDASK